MIITACAPSTTASLLGPRITAMTRAVRSIPIRTFSGTDSRRSAPSSLHSSALSWLETTSNLADRIFHSSSSGARKRRCCLIIATCRHRCSSIRAQVALRPRSSTLSCTMVSSPHRCPRRPSSTRHRRSRHRTAATRSKSSRSTSLLGRTRQR